MKFSFSKTIIATALAAAACSAGAAEFWSYVPGDGNLTVNNPSGGAGFAPVAVTGYNGNGGQFNGNFWDSGTKPDESFFRFFCIEIIQNANAGPNLYASSLFPEVELRKLYDVAYPNKTVGDFWDSGQTNFGVFADATTAAAFQVAVWNIVFDGDLSLSGGSFKWTGASSAVSTAAQGMLDQVAAYSGDGYLAWMLYKFESPAYQNYISATYRVRPDQHDVPEPATLGLLGLALAGVGFAARRKRG